jgi:hypothetical protein
VLAPGCPSEGTPEAALRQRVGRDIEVDQSSVNSPLADVLHGERVRFAVAGGESLLICSINFSRGIVLGKLSARAWYDRVDALTISLY